MAALAGLGYRKTSTMLSGTSCYQLDGMDGSYPTVVWLLSEEPRRLGRRVSNQWTIQGRCWKIVLDRRLRLAIYSVFGSTARVHAACKRGHPVISRGNLSILETELGSTIHRADRTLWWRKPNALLITSVIRMGVG